MKLRELKNQVNTSVYHWIDDPEVQVQNFDDYVKNGTCIASDKAVQFICREPTKSDFMFVSNLGWFENVNNINELSYIMGLSEILIRVSLIKINNLPDFKLNYEYINGRKLVSESIIQQLYELTYQEKDQSLSLVAWLGGMLIDKFFRIAKDITDDKRKHNRKKGN